MSAAKQWVIGNPNVAASQAVYAKLPRLECKGLCRESCGPIQASALERSLVERSAGRRVFVKPDLSCSLLTPEGKCLGYEARPLICRLFGQVERMRCPFGCVPERWLSDREAFALLKQAEEIGVSP